MMQRKTTSLKYIYHRMQIPTRELKIENGKLQVVLIQLQERHVIARKFRLTVRSLTLKSKNFRGNL